MDDELRLNAENEENTAGTAEETAAEAAETVEEASAENAEETAAEEAVDETTDSEEAVDETTEEAAGNTAEENGEFSEELEQLRDTFQKTYDETAASALTEPVIQELEYEEEKENSSAKGTEAGTDAAAPAKKKKHGKARIIIPSVIAAIIIIVLGAVIFLFVKVPDFSNFLNAYTAGSTAENASDAVTYYETALGYCTEDSVLAVMKQSILEEIVLKKAEAESYGAAFTYMSQNMTDEMISNPISKEFKKFTAVADTLDEIAKSAFNKVKEAVGDEKDAANVDADAIVKSMNVSSLIEKDVKEAVELLIAGVTGENAGTEKEDTQAAITSYLNAYSKFDNIGADAQPLLEEITLKMYNYGYAYEAKLMTSSYFSEDQLAASSNEEFKTMVEDLGKVAGFDGDIYEIALDGMQQGKTTEADFADAIGGDYPENITKFLANLALTIVDGINAESEKNLTKAVTYFETALGSLSAFELPLKQTAQKTAALYFESGDTQNFNSVMTTYLENEDPDEEFKSVFDTASAIYNAQYNANEVFYPYYYNYAYSGTELNKAEINAALDELIKEDSNSYDKGYVDYYKYLAEAFTDGDDDTMRKYLLSFADYCSDYVMGYGYALCELYSKAGEYEKMSAVADNMLAVNVADDFANGILSLNARISGNIDNALTIALAGEELSGEQLYSTRQAAICSLLKGDFEGAASRASSLFESNLSTQTCELIKIIAAAYDGEDENLKAKIDELDNNVDDVYAQYEVTLSDDAQAFIDGTKTLEDLFLGGTYDVG